MSYLDHDGLAYFKSKLDRTFIADIVFDDGDILLYGGDGTLLKTVVQEGTVTQKKSTTNKEYPILLCWDADAEEDQTMKTVWYGLDARINPKFGYLYARRYYTEHPSYERTNAPTTRTEWHHMFTDAVSAPMGEVYEYLDRVSDGGEHRMELRLYGNPLSQYVDTPNHNEATDAVSIGVGATRGDTLTFFGYCPSTPIYLENGSTMRKSTVRGDQYGKDIITRDWLNLNGSITGLVHTYMDETIDGYKTFLKTVTIDSGDDNNKAGLNVQGDVNIDSGDNTKPSNLYVQGNNHTHGNETVDGNSNVGGNLTVTGKITGNGTAEFSGGSGSTPTLKVNGDATITGTTTTDDLSVTDDATIGDDLTVNGDEHVKGNETVDGNINVGGAINKQTGNTTQEYVTYVVNQNDTRKDIAAGLVDTTKGLAYNSSTGKIYVNANTNKGIGFDANGKIYVDFSQIDTNTKAEILSGLDIQVPIKSNFDLIVNPGANNDTDNQNLPYDERKSTPFTTIQGAVNWASSKLALGTRRVTIRVYSGTYHESVSLPEVNASSGYISIESYSGNKDVTVESPQTDSGHYRSCMSAGSGACHWVIKHLKFKFNIAATSATGQAMCCIGALTSGAVVECYGCDYIVSPVSSTIGGEQYSVRTINADNGGVVHLLPDDKGSSISLALPTNNNANIVVTALTAARNGRMYFRRSTVSSNGTYSCSGTCSVFMEAWQAGGTNLLGGSGTQVAFTGTVNCASVSVKTGSYVIAPTSGFPGDTAQNYVQSSTYCWASGID